MRVSRIFAAQVSALTLGLMLAGCGDGSGGGVVSTGPGPASYTKIADLTGDHTFQTAGVQYNTAPTGFANSSTQALGSGVTIAYTASTNSYKLTAPDGSTTTFGPADLASNSPPPLSVPPPANTQQWFRNNGTTSDSFRLTVPQVNGVALSYTVVADWEHVNNLGQTGVARIAIGGMPTLASDMPRTGSATYATAVTGTANRGGISDSLTGNSTATFSADFAHGSVTTALNLVRSGLNVQPLALGSFNGTGTISSTGPDFTGTLSGGDTSGIAATGAFAGAFFGPKALEMGYAWYVSGGAFSAVGAVTGVKQ
jgi:hypothetical protein